MTFTNHVLTGSVLGAYLPVPVLLPVGLVSHFVLDALPHWDMNWPRFNLVLVADILTGVLVFLALFTLLPEVRWQMAIGAFLCSAPDLQQIPKLSGRRPWLYPLYRVHHGIQWSQTAQGSVVEGAWAAAMVLMLQSA